MSIAVLLHRFVARIGGRPAVPADTLATSNPNLRPEVLRCRVAYNPFGGYCVPESSVHRPATQTILKGEVWEPETIACLMAHATRGDVIHAGTYFGDFLPAVSTALRPGNILWAFEPHPENFRCATITIALNALSNVRLINAGLGASPGTLELKTADENGLALGGGSRIASERDDPLRGTYVHVNIVRIDDVVPVDRNVSILQLDVERFEQPALAGAMQTIRRCRPVLIVEHLPAQTWVESELLPLGYKITGQVHANTVLTSE